MTFDSDQGVLATRHLSSKHPSRHPLATCCKLRHVLSDAWSDGLGSVPRYACFVPSWIQTRDQGAHQVRRDEKVMTTIEGHARGKRHSETRGLVEVPDWYMMCLGGGLERRCWFYCSSDCWWLAEVRGDSKFYGENGWTFVVFAPRCA